MASDPFADHARRDFMRIAGSGLAVLAVGVLWPQRVAVPEPTMDEVVEEPQTPSQPQPTGASALADYDVVRKAGHIAAQAWGSTRQTAEELAKPIATISIIGLLVGLGLHLSGHEVPLLTFLTALFLGRLTRHTLTEGLLETGKVSVMIFIIIAGVLIFSRLLAFSGFTQTATDFIVSLPVSRWWILIGFLIVYLILGCFLDAIGMMALTLPIFGPIVEKLGFDMIWFGILVVKMIEIALITPPVGLNVYVLRGAVPQVSTAEIFRGIVPFLYVQLVNVAVIMLFPEVVLWLPRTMGLTK